VAGEALRDRLAGLDAQRTLTKVPVALEDRVTAAFLSCGERLPKTAGQMVSVDGGLEQAFLR